MADLLSLNEYQNLARKTAIYPSEYRIVYPTLGLAGEVGEVAELVKKMVRDDNGNLSDTRLDALRKEIGDVLWYVANICSDLGLSLQEVAQSNLEKLSSRAKRGKLQGDGDNR